MKKWLKRFFVAVVLLLAIFLALLCEEHFRGEWTLHSRLKELAALHEKLEIAELQPPKVPPEQNAAFELFKLTNSLSPFFKLSKSAPPLMKIASPAHAYVSWQRDSWPLDEKTSNSWTQFGPEIEAAMPELDRLESIWSKPEFDDGFEYFKGFADYQGPPLLVFCKQTVVLLSSAVADDLHRGRRDLARNHLHSLLAVTKGLGKEHLLISQLVDVACVGFAFNTTWEALQAPGWNDSQLAELQAEWDIGDLPSSMATSFEMEREMTLVTFREFRSSHAKALKAVQQRDKFEMDYGTAFGALPAHGFYLYHIYLPIWEIAWIAQDELHDLNRSQLLIECARTAASNSWLEARHYFLQYDPGAEGFFPFFESAPSKPGLYDKYRFLFSESSSLVGGAAILRPLKFETEKNMAIAAIALKRYQVRYSKQAGALSDLVPEFLAALPIDRMDGKPLRYHLNVDGSFKLYSVGTNGTDEDGDASSESATDTSSDIWKGKDAVWPMPPHAVSQGNESDSRQRH